MTLCVHTFITDEWNIGGVLSMILEADIRVYCYATRESFWKKEMWFLIVILIDMSQTSSVMLMTFLPP